MINLLPPNASALERAIAATGAGIDTLPVAVRDTWNPTTCPVALLPWLAWALAVDEWDEAWAEDVKRSVIADAIEIHRHRGTVWALKKALAPLGMAIDVIDQTSQRASYAELNALRMDGGWQLDSTRKITPVELYANLPQIQHWAQFIVRANLADGVRAENFALLRHLVEKWKPARSWPIFMFWLIFALEVRAQAKSSLELGKQIATSYPWQGRTISDARRWQLGRDGAAVTLPQAFDSFRLGEQRGAISAWRLRGGRIDSAATMHSATAANVYRLPQLAEFGRRLDGAWRLAGRAAAALSQSLIAASSTIAVPQQVGVTQHMAFKVGYPANPARLGTRATLAPWRRLDGRWAVGAGSRPCRFGFTLRRDQAIQAQATNTLLLASECRVYPERLARLAPVKLAATVRRLDGSWRPGAENRLGRFPLDGRRLRAIKFAACPRIGGFAVMQGVSSMDEGPRRRLFLDGGWRVGANTAPQFNINIIKEVKHG